MIGTKLYQKKSRSDFFLMMYGLSLFRCGFTRMGYLPVRDHPPLSGVHPIFPCPKVY
jgi:hypothetical protein